MTASAFGFFMPEIQRCHEVRSQPATHIFNDVLRAWKMLDEFIKGNKWNACRIGKHFREREKNERRQNDDNIIFPSWNFNKFYFYAKKRIISGIYCDLKTHDGKKLKSCKKNGAKWKGVDKNDINYVKGT